MTAPQLETFCTDALPRRARSSALRAAIEQAFPGMHVSHVGEDAHARIRGAPLGRGAIFELETSPKRLRWSPPARARPELNVLLAVRGECRLAQAGREARLAPERFAFVDGAHPFELSVDDRSSHVLLQIPHELARVEARIAADALARASSLAEAGDLHLARALRSLAITAPSMAPEQRSIAERAVVSLLSLASVLGSERDQREGSHWLRRAFGVLDARAREEGFDAGALAETLGVSRRYLDRIFARSGTTASREIWERRLQCAADELRSPRDARRTILDIAVSSGFSDAAHFSRAFRRRFGCTPSAWRGRRSAHAT